MNITQLKQHDIERKQHIPAEVRTDGKDEVADWIESEIIDNGRWPMDMQDIAEEAGWSRQHVTNTIRDYFETKDGGATLSINDTRAQIEFEVPGGVDRQSYVQGYLRGWLDGTEQP